MSTKVERIDQSPMNAQRWCLTLRCGHELWVTSKRPPRTKRARCLNDACRDKKAGR